MHMRFIFLGIMCATCAMQTVTEGRRRGGGSGGKNSKPFSPASTLRTRAQEPLTGGARPLVGTTRRWVEGLACAVGASAVNAAPTRTTYQRAALCEVGPVRGAVRGAQKDSRPRVAASARARGVASARCGDLWGFRHFCTDALVDPGIFWTVN